jgi:hypothetical protein
MPRSVEEEFADFLVKLRVIAVETEAAKGIGSELKRVFKVILDITFYTYWFVR